VNKCINLYIATTCTIPLFPFLYSLACTPPALCVVSISKRVRGLQLVIELVRLIVVAEGCHVPRD
jgi:hypothetical protein